MEYRQANRAAAAAAMKAVVASVWSIILGDGGVWEWAGHASVVLNETRYIISKLGKASGVCDSPPGTEGDSIRFHGAKSRRCSIKICRGIEHASLLKLKKPSLAERDELPGRGPSQPRGVVAKGD